MCLICIIKQIFKLLPKLVIFVLLIIAMISDITCTMNPYVNTSLYLVTYNYMIQLLRLDNCLISSHYFVLEQSFSMSQYPHR